MTDWKAKIAFSVVLGVVLFAALLLPALVLQYRRYGRPSGRRLLGIAAASVYGVALAAFTLFPLPSVAEACGNRSGAIAQPVPFHFLVDIAHEAARTSWPSALTSFVTMQVVLNVVLFVPLGALLRSLTGRRAGTILALGFVVSFAIEATQYTGIWGLYPCGFRVADVDDLIANTTGTALGVLAAARLLRWIPSARELDRVARRPVSAGRRWLGMLLDYLVYGALTICLTLAALAGEVLVIDPGTATPPALGGGMVSAIALVSAVLVFLAPALVGSGASVGQRLVGIAPCWDDARGATLPRRLRRVGAVAGVFSAGQVLTPLLRGLGVPVLPDLIGILAQLFVLAAVIWVAFGDHRGLSGHLSGARMLDIRSAATRRP